MVTADETGALEPIKDRIAKGIAEAEAGEMDREDAITTLVEPMRRIRSRLAPRLDGLPDDATLRARLERLSSETLHTLVVSGPWDSATVGGDEVDVDWLLPAPEAAIAGPVPVAA
jgi:hypothetical protein